jgi:hypothetical protein
MIAAVPSDGRYAAERRSLRSRARAASARSDDRFTPPGSSASTKEHVLAHQPALADKFALASPPLDVAAVVKELQKVLERT